MPRLRLAALAALTSLAAPLALLPPEAVAAGRVLISFSVDWEGDDLREENLKAMAAFRDAYPRVKLIQFLNAAYFTKPGAPSAAVAARMRSTLRPGDENGLHIHGWKRLFEASGVTFRMRPNFWGTSVAPTDCGHDCGHDVPIHAYSAPELRRVVRFSIDALERAGFGRARSFRSGGWVAAPNVLEALAGEGIDLDSSAVPAHWLQAQLGRYPLFRWVQQIWPGVTESTQPWWITTPAGRVWELPDTGGLADYVDPAGMLRAWNAAAGALRAAPARDVHLHFGFHQETAASYLPRFREGLDRVFSAARQAGVPFALPALPLPRR